MKRSSKVLVSVLVVAACVFTVSALLHREPAVRDVYRPADLTEAAALAQRREMQGAALDRAGVFHAFSFTDRLPESGIRFSHKMVDDGGKAYKMIHYDHGNGLAAADVDGDGRVDLYFVNQVGANGLWRNLGGGRFEDVTQAAGVGLADVVSTSASFADIDNDGDPDLYVTTVRFGNHLFENDGTGRFTDITEAAGVGFVGHSSGTVFFDYDRDGLLDLFLTNVGQFTTGELAPVRGRTRFEDREGEYFYYVGYADSTMGSSIPERDEPNVLYRNTGDNRFVDVTEAVGLFNRGWSGDATAVDVNEDGWMDLYVLNMQGDDEYFENQGGERFVWKTADVFPRTPYGAMGVKVLDYNNDGRMDLYLTDMHSDMWETNQHISPVREKKKPQSTIPLVHHGATGTKLNFNGNALFRKEADGTFNDVAPVTGTETYWPWGVSAGDLNADGYEDLFVTGSMNYPFRYAVNSLLLNNRGEAFLDSEFIVGTEPRRGDRTAKVWFEVDCAVEQHGVCDEAGATGRVDVWGALGSRSSVIFDLDDDGDLDIVTSDFNSEPMVLVSDLAARRPGLRFVQVKLRGTASNRDGLGATVRVHAGGMVRTQVYDGKSGYLAQSAFPLYFGLGDAGVIDRIEVRWPSGRQQVVEGPLRPNEPVEIVEPVVARP